MIRTKVRRMTLIGYMREICPICGNNQTSLSYKSNYKWQHCSCGAIFIAAYWEDKVFVL